MNDRGKLVELLYTILPPAPATVTGIEAHKKQIDASYVADYLIYNCVTIREPGEWKIITDDYGNGMMECSRCGSDFYDGDNDTVDCLHNFCPNCGAPMKGESK